MHAILIHYTHTNFTHTLSRLAAAQRGQNMQKALKRVVAPARRSAAPTRGFLTHISGFLWEPGGGQEA